MLYKISILKNSTTLTLFAMGEGGGGGAGHTVPTEDCFICCESISDLENVKFSENS